MRTENRSRADVIAYDSRGKPVLFVEASGAADLSEGFLARLRALRRIVDFGVFVDPYVMRIYRKDEEGRFVVVIELKTDDVFHAYDPDFDGQFRAGIPAKVVDQLRARNPHFGLKRFSRPYLAGLTSSWLSDLAQKWSSKSPPAADSAAEIGLLDRLEGGWTKSEVPIVRRALR